MKNIIILLLIFTTWAGLLALSTCGPPEARAYSLKVDTVRYAPAFNENVDWFHSISNDSVIFSWDLDSIITTYYQLFDDTVNLEAGTYRFRLYPLDTPAMTFDLVFYVDTVMTITPDMEYLHFTPKTEYYLILVDTTYYDCPDCRTRSNFYWHYRNINAFPVYDAELKCSFGTQRVVIDDPKPGYFYDFYCRGYTSYKLNFNLNVSFKWDSTVFINEK